MAIQLLIADDHAIFRSGLRVLLEKEPDFQVVGETGSGVDTLRALETLSVDVLLLDIAMPALSGPRTAEEALRRHPGLAIVVLTMHEDEYYVQEMLRIGARAYVLKKSTCMEVAHAIREAYHGHTYIAPAVAHLAVSQHVGRSGREPSRLELLTTREQEVCRLIAFGFTNAEVAQKLFISDRTVETHRTNIMSKLDLKNRAELVRFAIDNGLLSPI